MTFIRPVMLAAIFSALFGCNRSSPPPTVVPSTTSVVFAGSGIRADPGPGFKPIDALVAPPGVCLPTLVGSGGIVQVILLPADRADPVQAAAGLRTSFEQDTNSVPNSYQQSEFHSQSGLDGLFVTRARRTEKQGRTVEARSYSFLVLNAQGRCVAVDYLTIAPGTPTVVESIRHTITRD